MKKQAYITRTMHIFHGVNFSFQLTKESNKYVAEKSSIGSMLPYRGLQLLPKYLSNFLLFRYSTQFERVAKEINLAQK